MQFKVDGVALRKRIHELVYMVRLGSKGKDHDLRLTATTENVIHIEIQDTLGYGWSSITDDVHVTTPGVFYASSDIFTNVKVDRKLFGDDKKDRVSVVNQINNAAGEDEGEGTPAPEPVPLEPLWFDCRLDGTTLHIGCRNLNWEYTVHNEIDSFNKITVDNPDTSLVLPPYIAAQLAQSVKRAIPFANKFTKLGDSFACLSGVQLRTIPAETGAVVSVAATQGMDIYFDQIEVDIPLAEVSVLPPANFMANVFQICDFSKSTSPLQLDVSANMLAVRTSHHYVVHQNLDQSDFPDIGEHFKLWESGDQFGKLVFPVVRTHGYIGSVCTGMKKEVPITFQHEPDGTLMMTVGVARRSGKIRFEDVTVHEPITSAPDSQILLYLGMFEKTLEVFAKEGLREVTLTVYNSCGIFSANNDESNLKITLALIGRQS